MMRRGFSVGLSHKPTPASVLQLLKEGNERFAAGNPHFEPEGSSIAKSKQLGEGGQSPHSVVLTCADSRVVPNLAFDCGVGDLFTVRVAGNVVTESVFASIEMAVRLVDNIKVVVVLGHSNCAAVGAKVNDDPLIRCSPHMEKLFSHVHPYHPDGKLCKEEDTAILLNCKHQAQHLLNSSTVMQDKVDANDLLVLPAVIDLADGKVRYYPLP